MSETDKYRTIADRLWKRFGPGDEPEIRRQLYERLQHEAIQHGDAVYRIIQTAFASAQSANNPDRYFAAAVTRRLREQGFLVQPEASF